MKKYKTYQIVVIIIGLFLCFFGRFIPVSSGLSASGAQTGSAVDFRLTSDIYIVAVCHRHNVHNNGDSTDSYALCDMSEK